MTNPFQPTHDLYVVPMGALEKELKKWFTETKKVNVSFEFDCEKSESSFGHMGDLYFIIREEEMSENEVEAFHELFPDNDWSKSQLQYILEEFFGTKDVSWDTEPYEGDVHITIPK